MVRGPFLTKKLFQNQAKITPGRTYNFQNRKKPCGSKEIRLRELSVFGGQSRHINENSPTPGVLG